MSEISKLPSATDKSARWTRLTAGQKGSQAEQPPKHLVLFCPSELLHFDFTSSGVSAHASAFDFDEWLGSPPRVSKCVSKCQAVMCSRPEPSTLWASFCRSASFQHPSRVQSLKAVKRKKKKILMTNTQLLRCFSLYIYELLGFFFFLNDTAFFFFNNFSSFTQPNYPTLCWWTSSDWNPGRREGFCFWCVASAEKCV